MSTMVTLSFPTVNALLMPETGAAARPTVLRPLEEVLSGVAAAGVTQVGIDNFSVGEYFERGGDLDALPELLHRLGLECSDVGVLRVGERAASLEAAATMSRLAAATGAPICITAMDVPPEPAAVETLCRCADVLAAGGERMALEFLPYSPLSTLRAARAVCAAVGWEWCGVLIDSWMFFRGDNTFGELESVTAEEIGHIQFDDAPEPVGTDAAFESRHRRVLPGAGTFDLLRFSRTILDAGYDGVVSVEVLSKQFRAMEPVEQGSAALAAAASFWPVGAVRGVRT